MARRVSTLPELADLAEARLVAAWAAHGLTPEAADLIQPAPSGVRRGRVEALTALCRAGYPRGVVAPLVGLA